MKYVIIGNSTAAIACIEGIRTEDRDGEIVLISDENRHCYGRPLISYCLLGRIKEENMDYRPRSFYADNGVKTLLGRKAVKIDKDKKRVILDGGESVSYDRLLVATGSRPFVPPMDGLERVKDKFTFMTFDDMKSLGKALSPEKRVLVIGAGLIGLKCVEGILARVKSITVVDLADRILPSILDKTGSEIVRRSLEERGIEFILNDCALKFEENTVTLKNSGKKIDFDVLVVAVGVRPNVELVKDAGGEVGRGIVVDAKMHTSVKDIYAAGDCTEGYDVTVDGKRVLALLPNAYFQGKCAGINMADGVSSFMNGVPMNAIGFFSTHLVTAGIYEGESIERVTEKGYKKLFVKDGRLVGFILINDIERAGIYTSLIRGTAELKGADFNALIDKPCLSAFPYETRVRKLARKV